MLHHLNEEKPNEEDAHFLDSINNLAADQLERTARERASYVAPKSTESIPKYIFPDIRINNIEIPQEIMAIKNGTGLSYGYLNNNGEFYKYYNTNEAYQICQILPLYLPENTL